MNEAEKPTQLEDVDRLNLLLIMEQINASKVKQENLQHQFNVEQKRLESLQAQVKDLGAVAQKKYQMGENDAFDPQTGKITRGTAAVAA